MIGAMRQFYYGLYQSGGVCQCHGGEAMKTFHQKVDLSSRSEMIQFLLRHLRYDTMNSWNRSTSYACNLKLHSLGLDAATLDKLYDMLDTQEFFDSQQLLRQQFGVEHQFRWQAAMNGRNGGYLVLYQGELRTDRNGNKEVVCFPGRSTDDGEDFEDWTTYEIRSRVRLVQSFDQLADALVRQAVEMAKQFTVAEEQYFVPQVRKVLVPIT